MSELTDYYYWRGDLSFVQSQFNEIDNIILSMCVYNDLYGIVPEGTDQIIPLSTAGTRYFFNNEKDRQLGVLISADVMKNFRSIYNTPRFGNIGLCAYRNDIDIPGGRQFGAMTFILDENEIAVVFKGTDNSIVGWKEDFNLASLPVIPSQLYAGKYLDEVATAFPDRKIYLCGHSKGGNLAVYSASRARDEVKERIITIYSNDGPGFSQEFISSDEYQSIDSKVIHLIPQASVVGMLFTSGSNRTIVKSRNIGIFQHDCCSWELDATSFVRMKDLTLQAKNTSINTNKRINDMTTEEATEFVNTFFGIAESTGATTLSELTNGALRNFSTIIRTLNNIDKRSKDNMLSLIMQLINIRIRSSIEVEHPAKKTHA